MIGERELDELIYELLFADEDIDRLLLCESGHYFMVLEAEIPVFRVSNELCLVKGLLADPMFDGLPLRYWQTTIPTAKVKSLRQPAA